MTNVQLNYCYRCFVTTFFLCSIELTAVLIADPRCQTGNKSGESDWISCKRRPQVCTISFVFLYFCLFVFLSFLYFCLFVLRVGLDLWQMLATCFHLESALIVLSFCLLSFVFLSFCPKLNYMLSHSAGVSFV